MKTRQPDFSHTLKPGRFPAILPVPRLAPLPFLLWSLVIAFGMLFSSCEPYDDDPVFPASDFIAEGEYGGEYWPTEGWRTCDPAEVGMDPKKLKELNEEIRLLLETGVDVRNLLIVKDGYIVAEQYYSEEYGREDLHRIYSCTKSLVGACVGIAIRQGLIDDVGQSMMSFYPDREVKNPGAGKESVSLEHMLTMTAGLDWDELYYSYGDERNSFWKWANAGYTAGYVLDLPMVAAPGEAYAYSSGISHLLSDIVQESSGMRCDSFAREHLFTPLGIRDYYWPLDDDGVAIGGSGVRLRPRDMARFGLLYLSDGMWEGQRILPEDWVEESAKKHARRVYILDDWYGYQFWVSSKGYFSAVGYGGQWIMMHPEHRLVMVCNNRFEDGNAMQWGTPERIFNNLVIPAVTD